MKITKVIEHHNGGSNWYTVHSVTNNGKESVKCYTRFTQKLRDFCSSTEAKVIRFNGKIDWNTTIVVYESK